MPDDIRIEFDDAEAQEELTRLAGQLDRPRAMMEACGKQLEQDVRKHFQDRDREPNRKGWPSRHFWKREGVDNTALTEIADDSATVTIASPAIAHKQKGGPIYPQRGRALSIPLTAEAARVGSASLFPRPLTMIGRSGRPPLLVETTKKGKSKIHEAGGKRFRMTPFTHRPEAEFVPQYVLVPSVDQDADPRTLPPQDALAGSILERARKVVTRLTGATES